MLRRRRSAGALNPTAAPAQPAPTGAITTPSTPAVANPPNAAGHRIRLVPHLESRRSLRFDAISRDLKEGDPPLRIGRFTDRSGMGLAAVNALGSNKLAFKSKVVSRAHAEIWVEGGGKFYIRDTKSSSGTFLNHVRLSPANTDSRAHQIKDGDILQLGVDYQGGTEDIYKSVKIRIELGREWQAAANAFNTNALKNLKTLAVSTDPTKMSNGKVAPKSSIPDCCICLFAVTIRQALFIAPCSHTFHYKCIRPLLESHHPAFSCPLCRTFADLEEDVEVELMEDPADESAQDEVSVEVHPAVVAATAEREREAGAETEVEPDAMPTRGRRGAQQVIDLTDDQLDEADEHMSLGDPEDIDMVDVDHEMRDAGRTDSEGSGSGEGRDGHLVMYADEAGMVDSADGALVPTDATLAAGKRKR
ncbi:hypothetical protein BD626DRAFT_409606 [Schizophyllum amplum]|uniref:SMAD/FHA domain-containing protein n=1 Tax=Schizophyllum amplum TaxID=97359 RepID=A0A550C2K7_9AGAR|nr:hypothetical protein BD626DRAFT_409606 [Auriculariopsis ampla]